MEELEIMRQQLAEMKRRLDSQQIVNKDLLRKLMKKKASWLNNLVAIEIVVLPLTYLIFAAACTYTGISQWYALSYLILASLDVLADWRTVRIPARMFSDVPVLQLRKFLIRQKKERFIQTVIAAPLTVVWVIAFFYAMTVSMAGVLPSDEALQVAWIGALVGGGIGLLVSVIVITILLRRMQRTNDSLLRDISDLEEA